MNWLGVTAIFLGFAAFNCGIQMAHKEYGRRTELIFICFSILLALPAIVYAVYYSKLLGEPIWLYRVRTITGSELFAALAGLLAGWMHIRTVPHLRLSALGRKLLFPVLLGAGLAIPYLKPILRGLPTKAIHDQWQGAACLQSTPSTCGPAAAGTILYEFGHKVSERELATESFTSASGTENWYLARTLRRRGMKTSFVLGTPLEVPLPAIAGVRLVNFGNTGHFIALIDREDDKLILNDPLEGFSTNTIADLKTKYEFTGFFLLVQPKELSN